MENEKGEGMMAFLLYRCLTEGDGQEEGPGMSVRGGGGSRQGRRHKRPNETMSSSSLTQPSVSSQLTTNTSNTLHSSSVSSSHYHQLGYRNKKEYEMALMTEFLGSTVFMERIKEAIDLQTSQQIEARLDYIRQQEREKEHRRELYQAQLFKERGLKLLEEQAKREEKERIAREKEKKEKEDSLEFMFNF